MLRHTVLRTGVYNRVRTHAGVSDGERVADTVTAHPKGSDPGQQ